MHTSTLLTCLLAAAPAALAATPVDDSQCDCYLTNGTRPYYYKQHIWFDFRSLGQYAGTPDNIQTYEGNRNAPITSYFFDWSQKWGQYWGLQNWEKTSGKYPMINSKNNVYIEKNTDAGKNSDTYLSMRTARIQGFQTAAEFESINKYQYASMRMYSRTKGYDGACTSMFTYRAGPNNELAKVQEADIEFLTRERRNLVHYTNQPSYTKDGETIPDATRAVNMPNGKDWTTWAYHRMDWTPDKTVWSVDGKQAATIAFQVPRDPATLTFNAWSDGLDWTGEMPAGGEAWQQIQWIEILANPSSKESCSRVCSVDNTPTIGKPVRV